MSRNERILVHAGTRRDVDEVGNNGNGAQSFKLRSEIIPLTDGNGWRHLHMTRINWLSLITGSGFWLRHSSIALQTPLNWVSRLQIMSARDVLKSSSSPAGKIPQGFKLFCRVAELSPFKSFACSQGFPQNFKNQIPCIPQTIKDAGTRVQWRRKQCAPSQDVCGFLAISSRQTALFELSKRVACS
ncbi:hypothetical protein C8R45DRAFT_948422 [Mycena sanguinolenta]|nr:hypothetical protein C8R45DRAFT_948422 [Mycena sanguinolenta]